MRIFKIDHEYWGNLGLIILLLTASNLLAQDQSKRLGQYNLNEDNLAVQGYDVVSYFMGAPSKGKKANLYEYKGITYWFTTSENLELFKKQPDKFEPAYGGWCAYAMGESGEKVKVDPKTYKIIDGRNYLFYNFYFNNTLIDWNEEEKTLKLKANSAWKTFIK
jgi:YHS domain-containing protein